jgi:hypothetical protein
MALFLGGIAVAHYGAGRYEFWHGRDRFAGKRMRRLANPRSPDCIIMGLAHLEIALALLAREGKVLLTK